MIQQLMNGLLLGSTYSLIAIGYSLVFGVLKVVNLAHGEMFMIGGFLGILMVKLWNLPLPVALLGATIAAGLGGLLLDLICYRPVKKTYFLAPALSTLGIGIVLKDLVVNLAGSEPQVFPETLLMGDLQIGPVLVSSIQLLVLALALVLMFGLDRVINKTGLGRSMRAIAESETTAKILGINVNRVTILTFVISAALAGAAGVLIGLRLGKISPFIGSTIGIKGLAIMIIGGLGNLRGAFVSGILVGILELLTSAYVGAIYADVVAWTLLIIVLIMRPQGLFGSRINVDRV